MLLIDDCLEDRQTYLRYLSQTTNFNFNIIEAETGEDALTQFNSHKPELILLDYLLPDFDGLELIEYLQEQADDLPPIIMLSGQGTTNIAVNAIKMGIDDYCIKGEITAESLNKIISNVLEKNYLKSSLAKNQKQQQLISNIALRILQSLDLSEIFKITVKEIHKFLGCDRILLYRFDSNLTGNIVAESVKSGWTKFLGTTTIDTCFQIQSLEKFEQGGITTVDNLDLAEYSQCYLDLLKTFQVKAKAIVPILYQSSSTNRKLWGLLISHYCDREHHWQKEEIETLKKLSWHLSIAIQQAELFKNITDELALRRQAEKKIRQAQKQLHQANLSLEKRVKERTKELEQSKQAAETANRAKDYFLAHISHELRTPLNSILGFTQILKKDSNFEEIQHRHLDSIYQSGQHLLILINDLLDLSKITAKKLKLEPNNFDLITFLNKLVDMTNLQARQKGLDFHYQLLSPLPRVVYGDETRLRQVLLNLLNNAVKFTETGSVIFTVGFVKDLEKIRFQVQDTGVGIPAEQLKTIFLPFEQLSNNARAREGTGLGLTISSNLVQLMDSQIQIKSTLGQGSTFWFDLDLPAVDSTTACVTLENQYRFIGYEGRRRKILVVDDNTDNCQVLVNWLKPLGFELSEAENGRQGLAIARSFQPDLILLDLVMPIMDGVSMATKIRQDSQLKEVLIFAISANAKFTESINSHHNLFDAFLSKPVDLNQLLDMLEASLELEWITAESTETNLNISTPSQLIPDREQLEELLELAKIGDILQVIAQVESLEKLNERYSLFTRQVKQLANNFQLQKLVALFEKNLNE